MKVILSRKGFDSSNGGCPSPIMPDGTLLSMPIPSENEMNFRMLNHDGKSYVEILNDLHEKNNFDGNSHCHLDPDIRENATPRDKNWQAAFGQGGNAQRYLNQNNIGSNDLFLFFGWFRGIDRDGKYVVKSKEQSFFTYANLHIIYGYMIIDKVITDRDEIKKFNWHPHGQMNYKNNAIYTAKKYGTFKYHPDLVLTKEGLTRAQWKKESALLLHNIVQPPNRKNSSKHDALYYCGIWQELVLKENNISTQWANKVLKAGNSTK